MLSLDTAVKRAETVNQCFELRGHSIVIERGDKYQHIRAPRIKLSARQADEPSLLGLPISTTIFIRTSLMPRQNFSPDTSHTQTLFPVLYIHHGYFSTPYCSSFTGSSHSLEPFSPGTSMARWENQLSGAAPCQCFTPTGIFMQLPGLISTASFPHSW